jgi:hypothetical protein
MLVVPTREMCVCVCEREREREEELARRILWSEWCLELS